MRILDSAYPFLFVSLIALSIVRLTVAAPAPLPKNRFRPQRIGMGENPDFGLAKLQEEGQEAIRKMQGVLQEKMAKSSVDKVDKVDKVENVDKVDEVDVV